MNHYTPVRTVTLADARVLIFPDAEAAAPAAAGHIAQAIKSAVAERGKAVLGLATGATPEPAYRRLVEQHQAGELSFAKVTTYNLDEWIGRSRKRRPSCNLKRPSPKLPSRTWICGIRWPITT